LLRWLVLDLNSFFASCEQQENPELRGKPVIVVPTMADTTCAIAASYPAKAFGIKTGTLVREARRLCPDVQLVQAHHKLYTTGFWLPSTSTCRWKKSCRLMKSPAVSTRYSKTPPWRTSWRRASSAKSNPKWVSV